MSETAGPVHDRFLDETGDTSFYRKGRTLAVGQPGCSLAFGIGMLKVAEPLEALRKRIRALQIEVMDDPALNGTRCVQRHLAKRNFHFHAADDHGAVRQVFFDFIRTVDCRVTVVMARKIPSVFKSQHQEDETTFYADVLSHLLKDRLQLEGVLRLTIAQRGRSTQNESLHASLAKAKFRFDKRFQPEKRKTIVDFQVRDYQEEPILSIADYLNWAVQRVFERGDDHWYWAMQKHIPLVIDIYDRSKWADNRHYYRPGTDNYLGPMNKLSPPTS